MIRGLDFHPEARAEFFADVDWYDEREFGVGARFEVSVREAINRRSACPADWRYRVTTIVAVAHQKRLPGYWRDRVGPG